MKTNSLTKYIACASIVVFLCLGLFEAHAQNSMSLPQVVARAKKNGQVTVTISPIAPGVSRIVLQRKIGKGKFTTVATKSPSGTSVKFTDSKKGKKVQRYRAQFIFANAPASNWSVESTAEQKGITLSANAAGQTSNCSAGFLITLHELVNAARSANGLDALSLLPALQSSAQAHSNRMSARGVLSHDGWVEGIRAAGFSSPVIGQNVANGFPTPEAVLNAWLASPGHRRNILFPSYTFSGFGCTSDSRGFLWWSHDFGG